MLLPTRDFSVLRKHSHSVSQIKIPICDFMIKEFPGTYFIMFCHFSFHFLQNNTFEIFNSGWQRSKSCEGSNFDPVDDTVTRHDYQEIKIQENTQVLGVGVIPRSILVVLKDDLVDNVKAGGTTPCLLFVCFYSMYYISISASNGYNYKTQCDHSKGTTITALPSDIGFSNILFMQMMLLSLESWLQNGLMT